MKYLIMLGVLVAGSTAQAAGDFNAHEHVSLPNNNATLQNRPGFTLMAWVAPNTNSFVREHRLISYSIGTDIVKERAALGVTPDGRLRVWARAKDNETALKGLSSAAGLVPVGVWTHVAGTVDYASGVMKLYVNGVQIASSTASFGGSASANTPSLRSKLGAPCHGDQTYRQHMDGKLEGVYAYGHVLSAADIAANYATPGVAPLALARYPFNNEPVVYPYNVPVVIDTDGPNTGTPSYPIYNVLGPLGTP